MYYTRSSAEQQFICGMLGPATAAVVLRILCFCISALELPPQVVLLVELANCYHNGARREDICSAP